MTILETMAGGLVLASCVVVVAAARVNSQLLLVEATTRFEVGMMQEEVAELLRMAPKLCTQLHPACQYDSQRPALADDAASILFVRWQTAVGQHVPQVSWHFEQHAMFTITARWSGHDGADNEVQLALQL